MSSKELLEKIDPLSFTVVRLESYFNAQQLGSATGFFIYGTVADKPTYWLVTNWHVLSGRNADNPKKILHKLGALPNRLRLSLTLKYDHPEYTKRSNGEVLQQEQFLDLYDSEGLAIWYQHTNLNAVDVAVINTANIFEGFKILGLNQATLQDDMTIEIGNNVFILGYPLGFSHFMNTPIWKRGSIASEPNLETPESKGRVVIDATTRQGMSGAPVIMREKTHYLSESGEIKSHANATRWIGIYASRPVISLIEGESDEDKRPEVGYFYKNGVVEQIIRDGVRGPNFNWVP